MVLLSVSRVTLCCIAVFFNVLGVNTGFLCYNCLVMTIDSTLSVQELSNGNSLLLILMFLHPFLCLRLGRSSLYLPFLFLLCFQCHSLQHHLSSATIVTTLENQTFPLVIHVKSPLLSPPPKTCRVVLLNPWAWLKSPTSNFDKPGSPRVFLGRPCW